MGRRADTIFKYSLVSGSWTANGSYTTTFGGFGPAAARNGGGANLYVSTGTGATTANNVIRLTDTAGLNSTIAITTGNNVTLFTTAAGTIIKGLGFVPLPTYTVTYNGNSNTGGTAPIDASSPYVSGATVTVLANTGSLVRTGFSFGGCNTAADGTGIDYAPGATFTIGSNTTLFAKWIAPTTYTLTYDGNSPTSGTLPTDGNSPYASGATVTVLGNTGNLAVTGQSFLGWNTAVNGSGTDYLPAATFTILANTTLFAKYGNTIPTIAAGTTTAYLNTPTAGPAFISGVISDLTDPAAALGVDLTVNDAETAVGSLLITAISSNTTVVPNNAGNLVISGSGANRNIKIVPTGVGYSTITVTVTDGGSATATYTINYAASAASSTPASTFFHTGTSDASAAIAVDANYMFIGDDENNVLRLYNRQNSGLAPYSLDVTSNLGITTGTDPTHPEVDI